MRNDLNACSATHTVRSYGEQFQCCNIYGAPPDEGYIPSTGSVSDTIYRLCTTKVSDAWQCGWHCMWNMFK
jgi:hypothetical protein